MNGLSDFFQMMLQDSISIPVWVPIVMFLVMGLCLLTNTHQLGLLVIYILIVFTLWNFVITAFAGIGLMIFIVLAVAILILALLQLHHSN